MSISPSRFYDYIMLFGFGQKPNSGIVAEASGRVISPKKWKSIDHATISFGQAILVSPLQMVSAANVFANQGEWIQPYILDHIRDKKGKIIKEIRDNEGNLYKNLVQVFAIV